MQLSEENKTTLLINVHKSIEESVNTTANDIYEGRVNSLLTYPPNRGLTVEEIDVLNTLKGNAALKSALRKVLASTTADVFFSFLNIVDGTADPDPGTGDWSEVMLIDKPENFEEDVMFLHDEFYSSYSDWNKRRKNKNWSLDVEE
jgi:hypothetical protein